MSTPNNPTMPTRRAAGKDATSFCTLPWPAAATARKANKVQTTKALNMLRILAQGSIIAGRNAGCLPRPSGELPNDD